MRLLKAIIFFIIVLTISLSDVQEYIYDINEIEITKSLNIAKDGDIIHYDPDSDSFYWDVDNMW